MQPSVPNLGGLGVLFAQFPQQPVALNPAGRWGLGVVVPRARRTPAQAPQAGTALPPAPALHRQTLGESADPKGGTASAGLVGVRAGIACLPSVSCIQLAAGKREWSCAWRSKAKKKQARSSAGGGFAVLCSPAGCMGTGMMVLSHGVVHRGVSQSPSQPHIPSITAQPPSSCQQLLSPLLSAPPPSLPTLSLLSSPNPLHPACTPLLPTSQPLSPFFTPSGAEAR